jgi:hypothetical protein
MFSGFYWEGVIKFRLRPENMGGIMTESTICGETCCLMVWNLGGIIILLVAVHTFFGQI